MINSNFMVDFMSKSITSSIEVKKSNIGGFHSFKDTLNSVVNKPNQERSNHYLNNHNKADSNAKTLEGKNNKVNSYNDAAKMKYQSNEKEIKGKKDEYTHLDKKQSSNEDEEVNSDVVEQTLAKILQISVDDVKKLMESINLPSTHLTDETKAHEAISKISDLLGLESDQKETLSQLMSMVKESIKTSLDNSKIQMTDSNTKLIQNTEGWVEIEGVDLEVEINPVNMDEMKMKLKTALDDLSEKLASNSGDVKAMVTKEVESLIGEQLTGLDKGVKENQDLNTEEILIPKEEVEEHVQKVQGSQESSQKKDGQAEEETQDTDQNLMEAFTDKQPVSKSNQSEGSYDTKLNNSLSVSLNEAKPEAAKNITMGEKQVVAERKEIINQVVEKAKVVLSGDKSEMVMDLKPDHLGKLALKVVTERGMVVAKFVAESEQVKAAIEAHMDTLKESLEKQGFSVQGFSVSVGQDSQKGFNRHRELMQNNGKPNKEGSLSVNTVNVSQIEDANSRRNPYITSDSSIDLTA